MNTNEYKSTTIKLLMLTVAGIINAFGITVFLMPVNLYDSGVSGTSMLLSQITPEYLTLSIFLVVLNIPLFLFGFKKQGWKFTLFSIYTIFIYSIFAWLIKDVSSLDVTISSPFAGTDLLLCALFGGVISGVGSGLAIRFGGAMDGVEVMAVIFAKRLGLTVGTFVMIFNAVLYIIAGVLLESWVLPLYSIIAYFVNLKTIDYIVDGIDRAKCAIIITEKAEDVCKTLTEVFGSGVTYLDAKGGYSNQDKTMIYFIVNRYQVVRMKEIVQKIDHLAYITISDVADVFSNNKTHPTRKKK